MVKKVEIPHAMGWKDRVKRALLKLGLCPWK